MPTRPQTTWNKRASPLEKQEMNERAMRRKEQEDNERIARLNAAVDAANAAKKAVADVKSFTSKPKAGGTPLGRFGGQMAAMQNTAAKKAAQKAANDRSDVQMSKRVQSPTNTKAATPNTTPRQYPNPSQRLSSLQNPMTSSPRPPQKPMTSSPRPKKEASASDLAPTTSPMPKARPKKDPVKVTASAASPKPAATTPAKVSVTRSPKTDNSMGGRLGRALGTFVGRQLSGPSKMDKLKAEATDQTNRSKANQGMKELMTGRKGAAAQYKSGGLVTKSGSTRPCKMC